ncbi:uncharacterized protein BCR38DRAFT_444669 [Pseudomassariella vexata]|uniref:Uncharacterized protein n=1 Tax=Pseudomassariella vexata TaxID=1141098 RepID=A0A1Y2DJR0_9PEZI|nr:uncharacterized protein BCR38DRAFT_444669 [Pseudomassariella vexata]ORY59487.1 hypothetical protein BCR38DRAFT_444669 [Pseudomassariella vexata]
MSHSTHYPVQPSYAQAPPTSYQPNYTQQDGYTPNVHMNAQQQMGYVAREKSSEKKHKKGKWGGCCDLECLACLCCCCCDGG